jgi:thioredoxin-like negative regulator of GroEL
MRILKFQAEWCKPCKALSEALADVDVGAPIEEIDVDKQSDIAQSHGVRSVPTLAFIVGEGEEEREVARIIGNTSVSKIIETVQQWR